MKKQEEAALKRMHLPVFNFNTKLEWLICHDVRQIL
jgi:hypothetical protein